MRKNAQSAHQNKMNLSIENDDMKDVMDQGQDLVSGPTQGRNPMGLKPSK